ncbi:MAG: hypothetical protein RLZZ519_3424, partial [Bacteroidota bacterium]
MIFRFSKNLSSSSILAMALVLAGCSTPRPWYNRSYDQQLLKTANSPLPTAPATFTLFMIGDCGKSAADKPSPAFAELKKQLSEAGPNSAVIYL